MDYHLSGCPACPECYNMLGMNSMPGVDETYWRCNHCDIWWDTPTLIVCLVEEEMFDCISEGDYYVDSYYDQEEAE